MSPQDFKDRTKRYALRVIELVDGLPADVASKAMGQQLLRCAASVASNYRASARAKSNADFISKMGTVEEECDESLFWLELLIAARRVTLASCEGLLTEGNELLAMTVASIRTAKASLQRS
jgi:four helix bundle protein